MHVVVVGETIETLVAVDFLARAGMEVTLVTMATASPMWGTPLLLGPRLQAWLTDHCPDVGQFVASAALPVSVNIGRDVWWQHEGRWQPHFRSALTLTVVETAHCLALLAECVTAHPTVRRVPVQSARLWHDRARVKGIYYWNGADDAAQRLAADAVWDGGYLPSDADSASEWWCHHQAYTRTPTARLPWHVLISFPEAAHPYGLFVLPDTDHRMHVMMVGRHDVPPPDHAETVRHQLAIRYGRHALPGDCTPVGAGQTVLLFRKRDARIERFIPGLHACTPLLGQHLGAVPRRLRRLHHDLALPAPFPLDATIGPPPLAAWFGSTTPPMPTNSNSVERYYQQWFDPVVTPTM